MCTPSHFTPSPLFETKQHMQALQASQRTSKLDGVLETWLQGPDFGPILVNNYQNLGWRQFSNVSIDTLYFSVFYGGSSEMFMAHKDEVISCSLLYADLVTLVLCLVQ